MKIGIRILGCPKNTADCEILAALLKKRGHELVKDAAQADLVLIDTCGFIEAAKRETIDTILDFVYYKKSRRDLKIAVKGCMVQRYYEELKKEIPEVDLWMGVLPPREVVKAIEKLKDNVKSPIPVYEDTDRFDLEDKPYAYIKIADGCDRNCTFCAIPLFKGKYKSRPIEILVEEAKKLLEMGKKELVLVSQDSTAYGTDLYGFQALPDLLKGISKLKGDFWIRVMYLHPDYLTDEIIEAISSVDKVVPYFEVPIQHASDKILKLMGRIKKKKELLKLFERIRNASYESTIRTTVMVGFPGETEEDFQELLDFIEKIHPDRMGVFVYSSEEGTVASTFKDKVEEDLAKEREEIVFSMALELMGQSNERWLGKRIKVLIEDDGVGRGITDAPEIDGNIMIKGNAKVGEFVKVLIKKTSDIAMEGEVVG